MKDLELENKELKRKLKKADEMNKQQLELILHLSRQVKEYEQLQKVKRIANG